MRDRFDEINNVMDENIAEYEKNMRESLDNGEYRGMFALNGVEPNNVYMRNNKTFISATFCYPDGEKLKGVYDYAMNFLVTQDEQWEFERSTRVLSE